MTRSSQCYLTRNHFLIHLHLLPLPYSKLPESGHILKKTCFFFINNLLGALQSVYSWPRVPISNSWPTKPAFQCKSLWIWCWWPPRQPGTGNWTQLDLLSVYALITVLSPSPRCRIWEPLSRILVLTGARSPWIPYSFPFRWASVSKPNAISVAKPKACQALVSPETLSGEWRNPVLRI